LQHPNLIQLHELFADGDLWYFTMELVPGVTFLEYLRQAGDLPDDISTDYSSALTFSKGGDKSATTDNTATVDAHDSPPDEATVNNHESPPDDSATADNRDLTSNDVAPDDSQDTDLAATVDVHGTEETGDLPTAEIRIDEFPKSRGKDKPKPASLPTRTSGQLKQSTGSVSLTRLRESFRQLALGLIELHSKGMLHRDIKPANVIIAQDGRVVLLDFGLVAEMNATQTIDSIDTLAPQDVNVYETVERGIAGTVAYMAPEQAQGKPLSIASDWYAVGTMLYEALTERLPYTGKMFDMLRSKIKQDPVPPNKLNPAIPADLNDLTMQLLRRNPKKRIVGQSVLDLLVGETDTASLETFNLATNQPFVGRENEIQALLDALDAARGANTVVAEVFGTSGMGKSTLIDEFVKRPECKGDVIALQGRCYEQESVPYKAIDAIIDELTRYLLKLTVEQSDEILPPNIGRLARLFPVLRRVKSIADMADEQSELADPRQLRLAAFAALGNLIDAITETETLVLTIDDMQWGDVDSAILLNQLLQFGFEFRLLLVIGYRVEYVDSSPCLKTFHSGKWRTGDTSSGSLSLSDGWTPTGTISFKASDIGMASITLDPGMLKRIEVPVMPLTPVSVCDLVMRLIPRTSSVSQDVIQQIVNESGGNPYFALELVRYIESGRQLDAGQVLYLDEVLWNRVIELPETAQRFLEVIAVAGQPLEMRHVFQASQLEQLNPRDLRFLHTGRFIRSTGTGLEDEVATFHDRVRESVVDHLDADRLKQHHLSLGDTLAEDPNADAELVAHCYHQAGKNSKACRFYIKAADATATALAFTRAAELYRFSLQLLEPRSDKEFVLRKKLADALASAGRGTEAAEEYQTAARLADGSERIELDSLAAFHHCTGGRIEKGRRLLQQALKRVGLKFSDSSIRNLLGLVKERLLLVLGRYRFKPRAEKDIDARVLVKIDTAWRAATALSLFDTIAGVYMQSRMLRLALKAGERRRVVAALAWGAGTQATSKFRFDLNLAEKMISKAKALAEEVDTPYCLGMAALGESVIGLCRGQFKRGRDNAIIADDYFRTGCTGVTWERDSSEMFHTWSLVFLGEFNELNAYSEAAVFDARERGDVYSATSQSVFALAWARMANGDPDGAEQGMEENMVNWAKQGYHMQHLFRMLSLSMIGIYRGRPEDGWALFETDWAAIKRSMLLEVRILQIDYYSFKGRAAVASLFHNPKSNEFLQSAQQCARRLEKIKIEWAVPQAHGIRAGLASIQGDKEQSVAHLRNAIAGYDATDMAAYAASSRVRLGRLIGGDEGQEFKNAGEKFMRAQQVNEASRIVDVCSPGFAD
jgi:hypothetical protein